MKNRLYNSINRAVIDEFGAVRQVTNYYPFGGVFSTNEAAYTKSPDAQPYKYNGKELDRTHGLDWYDYGARNYDAIVPMFTSIDPHCEKYYNVSPYAYCANRPTICIDPNGCDTITINNEINIKKCDGNDVYMLTFQGKTYTYKSEKNGTLKKHSEFAGQVNNEKKLKRHTKENYKGYVYSLDKSVATDNEFKKFMAMPEFEIEHIITKNEAFLVTGNEIETSPGMDFVSKINNDDILEISHNHPAMSGASPADKEIKKSLIQTNPQIKFNILRMTLKNVYNDEGWIIGSEIDNLLIDNY